MAVDAKLNTPVTVQFSLYQPDGFTRLAGQAAAVATELWRSTADGDEREAAPELVTVVELVGQPGEYVALFVPLVERTYTLIIRHAPSSADLEETIQVWTATHSDINAVVERVAAWSLVPLLRNPVDPGAVVELRVRWVGVDGVAFEPDTVRQVVIRNADTGVVLFTIGAADIAQVEAGTYRVLTPLAIGEALTLQDTWYFTPFAGGDEVTRTFAKVVSQAADDEGLIITVQRLRDIELLGVDLTLDDGSPFPDAVFETAIREATAALATELGIDIQPTSYVDDDAEIHDYSLWKYARAKGAFTLDHKPVREVVSVKAVYPGVGTVLDFPSDWFVSTVKRAGTLNLVPSAATVNLFLSSLSGTYWFPLLNPGIDWWPGTFQIEYHTGFEVGRVPATIQKAVALLAANPALNAAGDLIAGAGIASKSVGIGGLSYSVGTTSSATNAGYGARVLQHAKEYKALIAQLKNEWRSVEVGVV